MLKYNLQLNKTTEAEAVDNKAMLPLRPHAHTQTQRLFSLMLGVQVVVLRCQFREKVLRSI